MTRPKGSKGLVAEEAEVAAEALSHREVTSDLQSHHKNGVFITPVCFCCYAPDAVIDSSTIV